MTPEALAQLHALCFTDAPRPWTADEFARMLADPAIWLFTSAPDGVLIARRAGPEAEILTLCTHPLRRRTGTAQRLLDRLDANAIAEGVTDLFLEVAETNAPARALYTGHGYVSAGYRKDYYQRGCNGRIHALVLRKSLPQQG